MSIQYMSQEKYTTLQEEMKKIKEKTVPSLAKRIDEARQMGDLSENAEYHAAREDMAWAQTRVKEIQFILDNAEMISSEGKKNTVEVGSSIVVKVNGKTKEYTIVGPQEADPANGKISNESPLGNAFLGKKKGEKVMVELPAGPQEYKIESVT